MKDVIVVGGGAIGLFCAIRLRKGGARVWLLESGHEHPTYYTPIASAAAAGMLAPVGDEPSAHEAVALESFELWQAMQSGAEWADAVRFDGAVVVRSDAASASAFAANAARLGKKAQSLSAGEFRKRTGFRSKVEHALFVEAEGTADPLRMLTGLAMQAHALGVLRFYDTDVWEVTATSAATHEGKVFEADMVVLAPGVWANEGMMKAAPALKHVRAGKGMVAAVELETRLKPNLRAGDFYLAQRRDDTVIGATLELDKFDRKVDRTKIADLHAAADRLLPEEVKLTERAWAGIRPMSPDGWPLIGPNSDGVMLAAGHSRDGWLMAPITAEIITAYVFGNEIPPAWAALSPERFEQS
ncbi:MAG: FAD-dependent oxidoreductase [Alphaproteobacteria bacterium]|nr:FAD-dependent oxidoreductase [Alphaproteobacteria bacterium]